MVPVVRVVHGSVTEGRETVLVNASNTNGALGTGVSGAIRAACGKGFQDVIDRALHARFGGPMPPGEVLITDAGAHPHARFVAHVAVMDYRHGFTASSFPSEALIRAACARLWNALEALPGEAPCTVAMVALGAGTGRLGARLPTQIACETLATHLTAQALSRIAAVVFYGFELFEYAGMVDVVSHHFTLPADSVSRETWELVETLRRG